MSKRSKSPEVHAGSMADIAFLLLIFFLVTTTIETDAGLERRLPRKSVDPTINVHERNILRIAINGEDELLLEGEPVTIEVIKAKTIAFIDNGGDMQSCTYCKGARDASSSDNPLKAIVSLSNNRSTTYGVYITVQNELVAAYNTLRNREAQRLYQKSFTEMQSLYSDSNTSADSKKALSEKIKNIQQLYPFNLSEIKTN